MTTQTRQKPTDASLNRQQGNASTTLIGALWGIAILCAAIAWFGYPSLEGKAANNAITEAQAQQQAGLISTTLKVYSQQISGIGSQSSAARALVAGNINGLKADIATAFPQADFVNVIPLDKYGAARLKVGSKNVRNNIELDIIRRAIQGDTAVEAYAVEGKWVATIAAPAKAGDSIVGAVLVSLPQSELAKLLEGLNEKGKTTLIQQFPQSKAQTIAETGSGSGNAVTVPSEIKNWSVQFQSSGASQPTPLSGIIAVLVMAGLASGAAVFLVKGSSSAGPNHKANDLDTLVNYLSALYTDPSTEKPKFSSAAVSDVADRCADGARNIANKAIRLAEAPKAPTSETMSLKSSSASTIGGPALAEVSEATDEAPAEEPVEDLLSSDPLFADTDLDSFLSDDSLEDLEDALVIDDLGDDLLNLDDVSGGTTLPENIFRAYDIRGKADTDLNDDVVNLIGRAIGSEAQEQNQSAVAVAMDGRLSSSRIRDSLTAGILSTGCDVIDVGMVPTPVLYFATHNTDTQSGVMITGSHNPKDDNGLKLVIAGKTYAGDAIQDLKHRIEEFNLQGSGFMQGEGHHSESDLSGQYINTITDDVAIAQPLRVVVDAGNGVAGELGPRLIEQLGCEVIPLFCEINGNFPNHHPDPMEAENLRDLIDAVQTHDADLGIAFDGDGDRVGVVSNSGAIIMPDRLLMLFAQDVVSRNPGADVIYDVKCTRALSSLISTYGGRPIMWKSGHSNIKAKMQETGALLAGELSGHIFFKERWFGFDDGLYSAARLIEILSTSGQDLDTLISEYPDTINTPEIKIIVDDSNKFNLIEAFSNGSFDNGKITTIDGVRVDFSDGWGLVRASNTTAALTLRFEADTQDALTRIQQTFNTQLNAIDGDLGFEIQ